MAMNRETKRMLQRQGQLGPDGDAGAKQRSRPAAAAQAAGRRGAHRPRASSSRGPGRAAQGRLAHPREVIRYSIIVLVTVVVLTAFIALLDFAFGEGILFLDA